jgi:hypothetical protein
MAILVSDWEDDLYEAHRDCRDDSDDDPTPPSDREMAEFSEFICKLRKEVNYENSGALAA